MTPEQEQAFIKDLVEDPGFQIRMESRLKERVTGFNVNSKSRTVQVMGRAGKSIVLNFDDLIRDEET